MLGRGGMALHCCRLWGLSSVWFQIPRFVGISETYLVCSQRIEPAVSCKRREVPAPQLLLSYLLTHHTPDLNPILLWFRVILVLLMQLLPYLLTVMMTFPFPVSHSVLLSFRVTVMMRF
jgi:hypothetical protein